MPEIKTDKYHEADFSDVMMLDMESGMVAIEGGGSPGNMDIGLELDSLSAALQMFVADLNYSDDSGAAAEAWLVHTFDGTREEGPAIGNRSIDSGWHNVFVKHIWFSLEAGEHLFEVEHERGSWRNLKHAVIVLRN